MKLRTELRLQGREKESRSGPAACGQGTVRPAGGGFAAPAAAMVFCAALAMLGASLDPASAALAQGTTVAETYREAYDSGYRDGTAAGQVDRRDGKLFDLANKKEFQAADRGFDAARHDREVYLVAYRLGFEDGYEKGYGLAAVPPPAKTPDASPPVVRDVRPPAVKPGSSKLPAGAEIQIELLDSLSTKYNERGDPFRARVVNDVQIGGITLIPKGAMVSGAVSYVKRAGRIRGRAQLNLRFEELRLPDGRTFRLDATVMGIEPQSEEEVERGEGAIVAAPSRGRDAKTVGTSSGIGALIGVIAGGKKGAGAGAAAGAVAGLANVLITRGRDAELESRTQLTIRLDQELNIDSSIP